MSIQKIRYIINTITSDLDVLYKLENKRLLTFIWTKLQYFYFVENWMFWFIIFSLKVLGRKRKGVVDTKKRELGIYAIGERRGEKMQKREIERREC